jgi:putative nucleotidyltransferase with HDIG domain
MALIEDPAVSAQDLEELIGKDPALAASVMRTANSAFYGGNSEISSIKLAVTRLGLNELKRTIVIGAVARVFPRNDLLARHLWSHCIATAFMSQWLSKDMNIDQPGDCFMGGMLHDIGKLLIYTQNTNAYGEVANEAMRNATRFYQRERRRVKLCTHDSVGARLIRKWDLGDKYVDGARFHHHVEDGTLPELDDERIRFIALLSLADLYANWLGFGMDSADIVSPMDSRAAAMLSVGDLFSEVRAEFLATKLKSKMDTLQ